VGWAEIVRAVEAVRGEAWACCGTRRGDWARPLAMWAARRYGGLTLREMGAVLGGMDYAAVGMTLKRFASRVASEPALAQACQRLTDMLHVET